MVRQSKPEGAVESREKLQVSRLWDADTLTSTYVDNVAILGAHKQDVSVRAQALAKVFEENRIPIVWSFEEPVRKLETVCWYWGGLGYGQCMLRTLPGCCLNMRVSLARALFVQASRPDACKSFSETRRRWGTGAAPEGCIYTSLILPVSETAGLIA